MKQYVQNQAYAIGTFLFLIPCLVFVLESLLLILGQNTSGFGLPLSCVIAIFLTAIHTEIKGWETLIWLGVGLFILIFGSIWVGTIYDCSFDGQWYHQDAIIQLSRGWNPVWDNPIKNELVSGLNSNYVNHYPKASWVFASAFHLFTGNIETGKVFHLIGLVSLFFLSYHFFMKRVFLSIAFSVLISFLLTFSTITLGQLFSFYVDGALFSFLVIFLILLIECVYFNNNVWINMILVFGFVVNLKFTGLVYTLVFILFAWVFILMRQRQWIIKTTLFFSVMLIIGVFVLGYASYIRNYVERGHPFYPIMGKNNEGKAIAEVQYAKDFFLMNRFEKTFAAHASRPIYTDHDHASVRKNLFQLKDLNSSLAYYQNHQPVTMSPLGPLTAELWVLFIPVFIMFLWFVRNPLVYFLLLTLGVSIIIQPECWNLRYAPQVVLIFVILLAATLQLPYKWIKAYSFVFGLLFLCNGVLGSVQNWLWVYGNNYKLRSHLEQVRNKSVKIQKGWMQSFELKLNEYQIKPISGDTSVTYKNFSGDLFTGWKYHMK